MATSASIARHPQRSTHTRRAAVTLAALAAAVTGAVSAAPAASAHDAVISSNPEEGSTVAQFPTQLELTMSAEPKPQFNTIALSEKNTGTILASGAPTINQNVLTFTLPSDLHPTAGVYTVGFQITSSDGHATRGSFDFTYSGDGSTSASANADAATAVTATTTGAADSANSGSAQSTTAANSAQADTTSSSRAWVWWVGAVVALAVIGGIAVALRRGARRS